MNIPILLDAIRDWCSENFQPVSSSNIGSSTQPIYMNNGTLTECGALLDVSITGNATSASKDGRNNIISQTYLPLSGGVMKTNAGLNFNNGNGNYMNNISIHPENITIQSEEMDGEDVYIYKSIIDTYGITFNNFNSFSLNFDTDTYFNFYSTNSTNFSDSFAAINSSSGCDLGRSAYKWKNVYATNGTIQTSDRNEKNTIEELSVEKAKSLILGLKPSTYKMNAGSSGRTHWGLISQDIEELMDYLSMDSTDFAGFIKSPKVNVITEDENGKPLKEPIEEVIEGEYDYSLRYDEFISPMIKVIQDLSNRVEELEAEIAEIKMI